MDTPFPIDDTTLHAYVDGQLPPAEAAQVARWLQDQPEAAARVQAWQAQRLGLQALHAQLLTEPMPAALLAALRPPPRRWPVRIGPWGPQALAASVLLVLGVALGAGLGWGLRPWVEGGGLAGVGLPRSGPGGGAGVVPVAALAAAPAYVRDAAAAHALYTPERRHPVEVGAEQQQHLVQWLSRRLGAELHLPVLTEQGYQLVGGRLLPAGEGAMGVVDAGSGAALSPQAVARAQFMYESAAGVRLTLYVAVAPGAHTPPAFRLGQVDAGAQRSLYWADGPFGYALTGALPADALTELALQVHRQIVR